jgi:hypothetical protein
LRRNGDISGPNTTYSEQGEWTAFSSNTYNGIGAHTSTLSIENIGVFNNFNMFPNPANGNAVYFSIDTDAKIKIYNILGKLVAKDTISSTDKKIDITNLNKGIYIVKIRVNNDFIIKKLIKK